MLGIIIALAAEAKPLIEHYRLKADSSASGFCVFANEQIFLVQSGMGKCAAAAAVAYAQASNTKPSIQSWLNVGIAGQRSLSVGECIIAHKVIDQGSGQCWYPVLLSKPPCLSATVATVDRVQLEYPASDVYEMEAAGFFASASRFTTAELISVVKIISDNQENPVSGLAKSAIQDLSHSALPIIEQVIDGQRTLSEELAFINADPPLYHELIARFHLTQSQRYRLRHHLQRLSALDIDDVNLAMHSNVDNLFKALEQHLDTCMKGYTLS